MTAKPCETNCYCCPVQCHLYVGIEEVAATVAPVAIDAAAVTDVAMIEVNIAA